MPPSPRKECHNVNHCLSVIGPWVVVPASGQATLAARVPEAARLRRRHRHARELERGRVWFDGQIGSPVGQASRPAPFLLFHAVTTNAPSRRVPAHGRLHQAPPPTTGRSTVSARQSGPLPGTNAGQPLDLFAKTVVLTAGTVQRRTATCAKGERLVGSWAQLAFGSEDPPQLSSIGKIKIRTVESRDSVTAVVQTAASLPFVPLAEVQVGAKCTT